MYYKLFFLLALPSLLFAQNDYPQKEIELSELAVRLQQEKDSFNRSLLAQNLKTELQNTLQDTQSYSYPFEQLKGVSLLNAPDKSFRIFSWELYVDKDHYSQFGFIQKADGQLFFLHDKSDEMRSPQFGRLSANNWYGALYYNIQPFESNGKQYYLLFGRDSYSFFDRRKVLDILYFDRKGAPKFGQNIIDIKDGRGMKRTVSRHIVQYSAAVSAVLNYNPDQQKVIFDHLIYGRAVPGAPASNVPDGSYSGLELKKGRWVYIDKVFKDDPNNVLVNDQSPIEIMKRTPKKKRESNLQKMFGNRKK